MPLPLRPIDELQVRSIDAADPLLSPMLDDLARDYAARYPDIDIAAEMVRYAPAQFTALDGAFLVLVAGDDVAAGGGYRRYDADTAELKRVWTSSAHRRRGLGQRIVAALEEHAGAAGYRRIHLTTGPRQPEARALYLALGYTPVGDHDAIVAAVSGPLPFEKELPLPEDLA